MHKASVAFALAASTLLITVVFVAGAASLTVGVKQGDWIEYNVNVQHTENADSGALVPPDHDITWARMEITQVQGTQITLNIITKYSNGTTTPATVTLNLETGELGDDFIIPANLKVGDSFFDKHQGNISITSLTQSTVAGAQRNVISASTNETSYSWDQATGILLNAKTNLAEYTMTTTTNKTNLWAPPEDTSTPNMLGDPAILYSISASIIAIALIIGTILILQRKTTKAGKQ